MNVQHCLKQESTALFVELFALMSIYVIIGHLAYKETGDSASPPFCPFFLFFYIKYYMNALLFHAGFTHSCLSLVFSYVSLIFLS